MIRATRLPVHAYKTFEVGMPRATHWRLATCEEVACAHYTGGWWTRVDEGTGTGQAQAHYIRVQSGRSFTEERLESGLTEFRFAPGQTCFREHQTPLSRPQVHAVRGGDHRGIVGKRYIYDRPEQWRDDLSSQLDILRKAQS